MKDRIGRSFTGFQRTFGGFTAGQKVVAIIGTLGLLLAGFMVFRWASTPSYSPLFSNLDSADASAIIEELDAQGVPYELSGGGNTIMVPQDQVYATRIQLSGDGLPTSSGEGGYSLLDGQSLSTSQFQEQTSFKRAMEGELAKTIEAIDGVQTSVVHLALPEKQVFADEQDPATASVLLALQPGTTFAPEQVQAVVHLVASSIDGLDPKDVTVADSAGQVLSTDDGSGSGSATGRSQAIEDYQNLLAQKIQTQLDRVVGAGNSNVAVTADLDFDQSVTETTTYEDSGAPALSESSQSETYTGAGAGDGSGGGVVGPDGEMDDTTLTGTDGDSGYEKSTQTSDNAVNTTVERRENAPGTVQTVHISAVLDSNAPVKVDPNTVRDLITAAVGADVRNGDTVLVSSLPFDTTARDAAAADLEEAEAADASASQMTLYRNIGLGVLVGLMVLLAWLKGRKRAKQRAEATTYVVEQLRADQAARAAVAAPPTAVMALEASVESEQQKMRDELATLVERQPEDVASLLRGWLVEN